MQLKTILNRVHPVKGFVYEKVSWASDAAAPCGLRLDVRVRARRGSRGICSGCGRRGPGYDTLGDRRFDFVPLWGIAVVLVYALRRVHCDRCGVKVEAVPWAEPGSKQAATRALEVFLAAWAKRLSWREVGVVFGFSWERVFRSVQSVVAYGLAHRDLSGIGAIGVDEVAWRKGHKYLTLVYQIDAPGSGCRRLLHVAEGRTLRSLMSFFVMMRRAGRARGRDLLAGIGFVCSDMWKPYLRVIGKMLPRAVHILDRYHIVANLNKALDQVRAAEAKKLKAEGYEPHLKQTRWCLLKRKSNLTAKQRARLRELVRYDLVTVRAYLKVQALHLLWEYTSPAWAGKFLDAWCRDVMRSRIEPLKQVARSLRAHRPLIMNWFRAKKRYNAGIVEGLNANVKLGFRRAYGFRTYQAVEVALYHQLGHLPEPPIAHRFC